MSAADLDARAYLEEEDRAAYQVEVRPVAAVLDASQVAGLPAGSPELVALVPLEGDQ